MGAYLIHVGAYLIHVGAYPSHVGAYFAFGASDLGERERNQDLSDGAFRKSVEVCATAGQIWRREGHSAKKGTQSSSRAVTDEEMEASAGFGQRVESWTSKLTSVHT